MLMVHIGAIEEIEEIEELEGEGRFSEIKIRNPREAVEAAFALASHYHKTDKDKARLYAQESITLCGKCKMETYEQCLVRHSSICGILMPSLIHKDVIKSRFADLGL